MCSYEKLSFSDCIKLSTTRPKTEGLPSNLTSRFAFPAILLQKELNSQDISSKHENFSVLSPHIVWVMDRWRVDK